MTTPQENPRRALGRGLGALLPTRATAVVTPIAEPAPHEPANRIAIDLIDPNPVQPRRVFQADALQQLADSILQHGIIQPLVVRQNGARFQLVAGERRWRAARIAGLKDVPAVVQEISDDRLLEITLIENVQREDLSPIEEAAAVQRLINEFSMTHEAAADAVGRSRSATTNLLRLLKLAKPAQDSLMRGAIEMGHARALLALDGARQIELASRIAARELSVRETEALVQRLLRAPAQRRRKRTDRDLERLAEELSERLGTTVEIRPSRKGRGKLLLHYSSLDHLDQLLKRLK